MSDERIAAASLACELFKAPRGCWMSREELAEYTGLNINSVRRWVEEYAAHGIFVQRTRPRRPDANGGRGAIEYSPSPEWGGHGFGSPKREALSDGASVGLPAESRPGY